MFVLEIINRIEVTTPQGSGVIWLCTEYGTETSKVFTVLQDNGTIWEWQAKNIKVKDNITFNRKNNEG